MSVMDRIEKLRPKQFHEKLGLKPAKLKELLKLKEDWRSGKIDCGGHVVYRAAKEEFEFDCPLTTFTSWLGQKPDVDDSVRGRRSNAVR